jgi:hypothetical protein
MNNIKNLMLYVSAKMCLHTEIIQWPVIESEEYPEEFEMCINVNILFGGSIF